MNHAIFSSTNKKGDVALRISHTIIVYKILNAAVPLI